MFSRFALIALVLSPATCMAAQPPAWLAQAPELQDPTGGNVQLGLQRWRLLTGSDNYSFQDYAGFVLTYPGWPDDSRMRRNAEQALNIETLSPRAALAFFDVYNPLTTAGMAKYAVALQATGRTGEAADWARKAWRQGTLTDGDEAVMLARFGAILSASDHDARMDWLLWKRATRDAARQIGLVSPAQRSLFAARLAQLTESTDADSLAEAVQAIAAGDPGFLADRSRYLRNAGRSFESRQLLANRQPLRSLPADVDTWLESNRLLAKAAMADRQWANVYAIGAKIDDAFAPGTDVAKQPSGVRDKYSDIVWFAGNAALHQLRRPADAIALYDRYAQSYDSPQIRSKGYYWAGRAALAAGRGDEANRYFEQAAAFPDYFYGQLAHERLGRVLPPFTRDKGVELTAADRQEFDSRPLVIAAKASAASAPWKEHTRFYRALAFEADSAKEYALLSDLAARSGKRDLGVITALSSQASINAVTDATSFPTMPVPLGYENDWTMIHAITRQESQFAQTALSHANAHGLMQLIPSTARETAGRANLSYDLGALTSDPLYNIRLGSTYFNQMLNYFGGSYPLAVAAYNAGPGRVNQWLRENGDPRSGEVDWLMWIEAIPIFETRNYVHRVLENAVVYDSKNPRGPIQRSEVPLTRFIGKNYKG